MKLKKILIISGVVLVAAGVTTFTIVRAQSGYTKVLTAKVVRENLVSIVSGTGQIKPKTIVNIGATSFGRITHLYVKEGDRVKRGQILATVESVQAKAGVGGPAGQHSVRQYRHILLPGGGEDGRSNGGPLRRRSQSESYWIGSGRKRCTRPS